MGTPRTKIKVKTPRRRRYRLNKKKFTAMLLVLGCIAALIAVAVESLANAADVSAVAMGAGIPKATELDVSGQTQKADADDALKGRLIVLDAGHGGFDPGAIGISDIHEDDLNLAITQYLKAEIESCGAQVIMTREDENAIADNKDNDMAERRRIIEQSGSDIVISVHMNWYKDPDTSGPLVLFMPGSEEGRELAMMVQNSMNTALAASGCARSKSLHILQSGNMPCVLVECGYISNEQEEGKLKQQDYQQKVAKSICEGVKQYFSQTDA